MAEVTKPLTCAMPDSWTFGSPWHDQKGVPPAIQTPPGTPRRRADRFGVRPREDYTWTGDLGILDASWVDLEQTIATRPWCHPSLIRLRAEGERLVALDRFDELFSINLANVDLMPHQEAVARRVFTEMRGRAVLGDEAGLGKTIEAGLVVKELLLRGLARRVLVLCPAALRDQWRAELHDKFGEDFSVVTSSADGFDSDRLIMSTSFARSPSNMTDVVTRGWDVVVLDEAHKSIDDEHTQQLYATLSSNARYVLVLTATPVHNDLYDLYHLVQAVNPATFAGSSEFGRAFASADKKTPVSPASLRGLINRAIVRTTRPQAGLNRVNRLALPRPVVLSADERALYDLCTTAIRVLAASTDDKARAGHLAHRLVVSPYALGLTAMRMAKSVQSPEGKALLQRINRLAAHIEVSSRQQIALAQIEEWSRDDGSVLVFTQHTDTVKDLLRLLEQRGVNARGLHGGMKAAARAEAIRLFTSGEVSVIVATDIAAQGLNPEQRCYCVINYDLPLNPIKIEQRIVRVDRRTQPKNAVLIANLFAVDTVDERVYRLLHDKLRMFELRSGQIATVLGELDDETNDVTVEQAILAAVTAGSDHEQDREFADLGRQFEEAAERARTLIGAELGLSSWLACDSGARRERKRKREATA